MNNPFWEQTYPDEKTLTFLQKPSDDVVRFCDVLNPNSSILDVGCGEGRNAIFLAGKGHNVDAFDTFEARVSLAKKVAKSQNINVNFRVGDLEQFKFEKDYDVILAHGVLHLPPKPVRDAFIYDAQMHTKAGGLHFVGVFTNRLSTAPEDIRHANSLFNAGELLEKYRDWEIVHYFEGVYKEENTYETLIARKV